MKIRLGFISNSSATSFTIYGWSEQDLTAHFTSLSPVMEGVELSIDEYAFREKLDKEWGGKDWAITNSEDKDGYMIYGLGEYGCEIDHYFQGPGRWEDFRFPEPSDEDKKKMDEMAARLNLPEPKLYSDTFFA